MARCQAPSHIVLAFVVPTLTTGHVAALPSACEWDCALGICPSREPPPPDPPLITKSGLPRRVGSVFRFRHTEIIIPFRCQAWCSARRNSKRLVRKRFTGHIHIFSRRCPIATVAVLARRTFSIRTTIVAETIAPTGLIVAKATSSTLTVLFGSFDILGRVDRAIQETREIISLQHWQITKLS